jgi:prepilin-type N-terminal cleavage/methylation domain-containing protein/prepilin-type processing-associated H-X9-DG protein
VKADRPYPQKSRRARYFPEAFTLVEMLVTIAILGILASLLLPVLSKGKGSALRIQCMSQSKQIGLALQMYVNDNLDFLPWPNWGTNSAGWLYVPSDGGPPLPSDTAYQQGLLWHYIKDARVYWCPIDYTNTPYFSERKERLSSYIMNGATMGYYMGPTNARTHKLSAMNPSAFATWEPSDKPPYDPAKVFNDGASFPNDDEGPSRRHGNGCNVSAFDGHAQFLKFAVFEQEQYDKPGLVWCDPDTPQGDGGRRHRSCALWK